MKKLLVISMMIFGMCGVAEALTITNGGFETGDFSGWYTENTYGEVVTFNSDSFFNNGTNPTQGNYFASTVSDSSLVQNISWEAGDTLLFDWNFYTYDWLYWNDPAYFYIASDMRVFFADLETAYYSEKLADVAAVRPYNDGDRYYVPGCGDPMQQGGCPDYGWPPPVSTGWNTYSLTFDEAGSGAMKFLIWNHGDNAGPSFLYIDNVRAPAPVPEPSTFLLLGVGLAGLGFVVRRRRKE